MAKPGYVLTLNDLFTTHGLHGSELVNDADLHLNQMHVEALAASGDCFVTLATELDKIADSVGKASNQHLRLEMEKLTAVMLYLQNHYEILPKNFKSSGARFGNGL